MRGNSARRGVGLSLLRKGKLPSTDAIPKLIERQPWSLPAFPLFRHLKSQLAGLIVAIAPPTP